MPTNENLWDVHNAGEGCLILEFGNQIQKHVVDQVVSLNAKIIAAQQLNLLPALLETVPTFRSLAVMFDPLITHPDDLAKQIRSLAVEEHTDSVQTGKKYRIPVHYGNESGPDLYSVATMTGLPPKHIVALHQSTVFSVYMLGFLPGFAFMGDTPAQLHLPRRTEPRVRVPAGSVAIANQLTAVYPWDSPGGWHIIGNSPVPLFNGHQQPPALFKAGDTIQFQAIELDQYHSIVDSVNRGEFDSSSLEFESNR